MRKPDRSPYQAASHFGVSELLKVDRNGASGTPGIASDSRPSRASPVFVSFQHQRSRSASLNRSRGPSFATAAAAKVLPPSLLRGRSENPLELPGEMTLV